MCNSDSICIFAGFGTSLLCSLAENHPHAVARLALQYRMGEEICELSNLVTYNGALTCANDYVRFRTLALNNFPAGTNALQRLGTWFSTALDPKRPVIFVNTDVNSSPTNKGATEERATNGSKIHGGMVNTTEAYIIELLIGGLTNCGLVETEIGVISPFRAQVRFEDDSHSAYSRTLNIVSPSLHR
jgi:DNA replication ATP-dependent helicase Dna2